MTRAPAIPARRERGRNYRIEVDGADFDVRDMDEALLEAMQGYAFELGGKLSGLTKRWQGYGRFVDRNITIEPTASGGIGLFVPESRAIVQRMSRTGVFRVGDDQLRKARDRVVERSRIGVRRASQASYRRSLTGNSRINEARAHIRSRIQARAASRRRKEVFR